MGENYLWLKIYTIDLERYMLIIKLKLNCIDPKVLVCLRVIFWFRLVINVGGTYEF